jgi:DNA-binding NarL/FixJ family response regulator
MSKTILVIDDNPAILENILELLSLESFHCISAEDGMEGLQKAREHLPDLIISDITMPQVNGYELLRELRNDLATASIPFVFLSSKADHEFVRKGMEMGADDYLTKPLSNAELLAAVRGQLEKRRSIAMQQMRQFAHKLVEKVELERRSIAELLRNEIAQDLNGLSITMEISKQLSANNQQTVIADAEKLVKSLLEKIELLSLDLWPGMLEHLGLLPALIWQLNRFTKETGIQVDFQHSGLEQGVPHSIKLDCYRILQELLDNIALHAETQSAELRIWIDDRVNLVVLDTGKGFELDTVLESGAAGGLIAVQERVTAAGGDLSIVSRVDEGTEIIARLPIDAYQEEGKPDEKLRSVNFPDTLLKTVNPKEINAEVPKSKAVLSQTTEHQSIRLMLAHGNELVRHALRTIIGAMDGVSIVSETDDGQQVLQLVEQNRPAILLADMLLPNMSGLEIIRQIIKTMPQVRIIIMSSHMEEVYILEVLHVGAMGYVLTSASTEDIAKAIREVAAGRFYVSSPLSEQVIETYFSRRKDTEKSLESYAILTSREREILQKVVSGKTNVEIAEELFISPRTAETHRANMMRKLGLRNQAELIRYALERGLAQRDD